jgi:hypothetical protein
VDAKYRTLVPLSGLAAEKIEASLRVIHDFASLRSLSSLTALLT